jgi:hypothetical protein
MRCHECDGRVHAFAVDVALRCSLLLAAAPTSIDAMLPQAACQTCFTESPVRFGPGHKNRAKAQHHLSCFLAPAYVCMSTSQIAETILAR